MRCTQCVALSINGVICHETGCPDRNRDLVTGLYNHRCFDCGCDVQSESRSNYTCCNEENYNE
jgi:hypothetical protein